MISFYSGPDSTQEQRAPIRQQSGQGGPNFPNGPPRNGVLSSDPWQKIRKTAANGKHNDEVQLCAFDVLAMDGDDLRNLPLSMRKTNLARLLHGRPDGIFISDFEQGEVGPDLFRKACKFGLEV